MNRAKLYLGGGCSVMVLIGLYQGLSGRSVSSVVYLMCAAITVIIAIFVHGLEQYKELESKLFIGKPDYYWHSAPRLTHCYRIPIGNRSKAETIRNVGVQLVDIQPKPEPYTWGSSLPLQWKDTLKSEGSTTAFRRYRDVRAGTPEEMDFVQAMEHQNSITINHSVDEISEQTIPLPPSTYRITLEAKGDGVPPAKAVFEVGMDKHGKLQCFPLGENFCNQLQNEHGL